MRSRAREDEALALLGSTAQSDANDSHQRQIDRQKLAEQVFRHFFGERAQCMCPFPFQNYVSHSPNRHTSYLSFLLHRQDSWKPTFTPKKTTKGTKNTKNVSEKVIYMHFFHSFWKNLHLTENFYTDMSVVSVTNKRYGFML